MFNKAMLMIGLLAGSMSVASAADLKTTAVATAQSEYNYRGQSVSDEASVGLALRVDNLLFNGVFVTGDFNTLQSTPLTDLTVRSDVGVGYATTLDNVRLEGSVNHVFNPVLYSADYTEARARVGYSYFFGEVGQGLSDSNHDTYFAVGAEARFNPRWTASAKVSSYNYDSRDFSVNGCGTIAGCSSVTAWTVDGKNRFNNFEVSTTYNFWRKLDGFVTYSEGGRDFYGREIKNQVWGGIQYRF